MKLTNYLLPADATLLMDPDRAGEHDCFAHLCMDFLTMQMAPYEDAIKTIEKLAEGVNDGWQESILRRRVQVLRNDAEPGHDRVTPLPENLLKQLKDYQGSDEAFNGTTIDTFIAGYFSKPTAKPNAVIYIKEVLGHVRECVGDYQEMVDGMEARAKELAGPKEPEEKKQKV